MDRSVAHTDLLAWRPQLPRPTRRPSPVTDPIVEPFWSGTRVLAHFELTDGAPRLRLIDEDGDDLTADVPNVVTELGPAILALDAVVDGVLTVQATRSSEGVAVVHDAHLSATNFLLSRDPRIDIERPAQTFADIEPTLAFVALDLLRVDGQMLLDLPLLERKRLLEGAVRPSERVRLSVYTRPPVDPWVASWKGAGFKGAMVKAANGRYRPGGQTDEWVVVTRIHQR